MVGFSHAPGPLCELHSNLLRSWVAGYLTLPRSSPVTLNVQTRPGRRDCQNDDGRSHRRAPTLSRLAVEFGRYSPAGAPQRGFAEAVHDTRALERRSHLPIRIVRSVKNGPCVAHSFGRCGPTVIPCQGVEPDEGGAAPIWAIRHKVSDAPRSTSETHRLGRLRRNRPDSGRNCVRNPSHSDVLAAASAAGRQRRRRANAESDIRPGCMSARAASDAANPASGPPLEASP